MKRALATILTSLVMITTAPVPAYLTNCPTEDSIACTWHGDRQGNRHGETITNGPTQH